MRRCGLGRSRTSGSSLPAHKNNIERIFEEVFKKYDFVLRCTIFKRIGEGMSDSEDVIGDVYLALWKTLKGGRFRGECSLGTLVYVIVHRRIADYCRAKKLKRNIDDGSLEFQRADFLTPEMIFMEKENQEQLRERLSDLIDRLRWPRQKQILRLTMFGYTKTEIARKTNTSISSIYEAYRNGLKNLRMEVIKWLQNIKPCLTLWL